jgi:hypothetical protein
MAVLFAAVAEPENEKRSQVVALQPLGRWSRVWCSLSGAAALGAGGTAVFVSHNSAGTGALLGVGALFGYLGFTGVRLSRAKIGNILEVEAATAIVQQLVSSPNPEVQEAAAATALDSPLPPSSPIRQQAESVLYERAVMSGLLRVGAQSFYIPGSDQRFDAVFRYREKVIAVNAK